MTIRALVACTVVVLLLPGCGGNDDESGGGAAGGHEQITVFAASSLTSAFEDLGERFEADDRNVDVTFNFLSSSDLAAQIEQGSPADVFASADETNMERVQDGDFGGGDPAIFAHNKLEVIVPPDNPGGVNSVTDLARDDLVVSLCNDECPAGRYALEIFDNAGIDVKPDSLETEVKGVVTRVALGEADAGIAYVTDTKAAGGDVDSVPIPEDVNVIATYPIVALKDSSEAGQRFVALVLSDQGQAVLEEYGFLPK
jgi:molybdate transport system substrate-binding protein